MDYILEVSNITKKYRNTAVLKNLNMQIPKGSIYGFIGKNGAGKTTLIRIITGLQNPTSGSYKLYGVPHDEKEVLAARRRVGAVVENPALYLDMTAEENLKQQAIILGLPSFDFIKELLKDVGLDNTGKKKVRTFSLGMKQRLSIAIALVGNPDFLVLDEPINGLDPQGIVAIREFLLNLNREKQITILISSHYLDELSKLATYYGFIENGQIVKEISAKELDRSLRKRTVIRVTDVKVLTQTLDELNIQYEIGSNNEAYVYSKFNITELAILLKEKNCEIESIRENDESVESFYVNLVGDDINA